MSYYSRMKLFQTLSERERNDIIPDDYLFFDRFGMTEEEKYLHERRHNFIILGVCAILLILIAITLFLIISIA